jgi:MOB kinase activator 1
MALSTRRAPNIRVLRCQRGRREFCFSHSKSGRLQLIRGCRLNYIWTTSGPGGRQLTLPAPTYIDYVMTSIQNLIDDENVFPSKSSTFPVTSAQVLLPNINNFADQSFHPSFPATIRTVYRQLLRVFAHVYHAHYQQILHLRSEPHFNSLFAHFLAFGREYELLEVRDIKGEPVAPVGVGLLWERWKDAGILEG